MPTWNGDSASPLMLPGTIKSPEAALACPSRPSAWHNSWATTRWLYDGLAAGFVGVELAMTGGYGASGFGRRAGGVSHH